MPVPGILCGAFVPRDLGMRANGLFFPFTVSRILHLRTSELGHINTDLGAQTFTPEAEKEEEQ